MHTKSKNLHRPVFVTEETKHYFPQYPKYANYRNMLETSISQMLGTSFTDLNNVEKLDILLHGNSLSDEEAHAVARETMKFVINSKRFDLN